MLEAVGAISISMSMLRRIERFGEPGEVGAHAVDPHGVGVHVKERLGAELRQRLDHAAAGAEDFVALVGDDDARMLTISDVADDLVRKIVNVDHRLLDAGLGQLVEHVIEQGLSRHLHQRFWNLVR